MNKCRHHSELGSLCFLIEDSWREDLCSKVMWDIRVLIGQLVMLDKFFELNASKSPQRTNKDFRSSNARNRLFTSQNIKWSILLQLSRRTCPYVHPLCAQRLSPSSCAKESSFVNMICVICFGLLDEHPPNLSCGHRWCRSCIIQCFSNIRVEKDWPILCIADCCIPLSDVQGCLEGSLIETLRSKIQEYETPARDRLYCCVKQCSNFIPTHLITNGYGSCPACGTQTCSRCWKSRHDGLCGSVDIQMQTMLRLAKQNKWAQCTECSRIVERIEGCNHMSCHCGHHFCYLCAGPIDVCNGCPELIENEENEEAPGVLDNLDDSEAPDDLYNPDNLNDSDEPEDNSGGSDNPSDSDDPDNSNDLDESDETDDEEEPHDSAWWSQHGQRLIERRRAGLQQARTELQDLEDQMARLQQIRQGFDEMREKWALTRASWKQCS